jgi:hypothetical protein
MCIYCFKVRSNRTTYLKIHTACCSKAPTATQKLWSEAISGAKSTSCRVGKRKNCQIDAHASEATAFDYPGKLTAPPYSYKPLQLTFRCFIDNTLAIGLREPQEDPSSPVQACELEDEGKVGGLLKYKDRTLSKIEIESFDRQFAVWGYNHGLSFAQLTDPDLPRILGFLNRSYTSRSMLSDFRVRNTYLNDAYRAIRLRVASSIRSAPAICLVTDGWTSVQRSHQLCVTLTTPTPVFFRTIHTGSQSVTAEFQAESLVNSLDDDSLDIDAMCTVKLSSHSVNHCPPLQNSLTC